MFDHVALVLGGGEPDLVRLALVLELLGHLHHLVERLRRRRDEDLRYHSSCTFVCFGMP